jgi:hypothetical protein
MTEVNMRFPRVCESALKTTKTSATNTSDQSVLGAEERFGVLQISSKGREVLDLCKKVIAFVVRHVISGSTK